MKKIGERADLFWVITPDHKEDWFIIACNEQSAERLHEEHGRHARGDAIATLIIADVPLDEPALSALPRRARLDDLRLLGFEIIDALHNRAVKLNNVLFLEGGLQSLINTSIPSRAEVAGARHATA
jgi:hypothetical protein